MSRIDALQIAAATTGPAWTPAQKRFNTLVRQIEQTRKKLATWDEGIAVYRQVHAEVVVPLRTELMVLSRQWAFALDALLGQRGWTKAERETLRELVCDEAADLLAASEDDEELKALYARHAGTDFETERQEMVRTMKDL